MTRRLRLLNYAWHAGHQYELHKLEHEFTLLVGPGVPGWKFKHRPIHRHVRVAREHELDLRAFDAAVLHFDEHVLEPWGDGEHPFLRLNRDLAIPRVAICHGTPPLTPTGEVDDAARQRIVEAVGDTLVVCNSHAAAAAWGFRRSRTIWHGFDADEYPLGRRARVEVLTTGHFGAGRKHYQGQDAFERVTAAVPCALIWSRKVAGARSVEPRLWLRPEALAFKLLRPRDRRRPEASGWWLRWVGNPYARVRFAAYRRLVQDFVAYFNPTRHSPMPRARAEAMLSGLAVVTTNHHDEERFIDNEVDGFWSNDVDQLVDYLRHVVRDPAAARKVGERGRAKATQVFALSRYLDAWRGLLRELTA